MAATSAPLRERARTVARTSLERLGLVRRSEQLADLDPGFLALYERCRPFTMTTVERMSALHDAVRYVTAGGVAGDYVECGVWRGGSSMLAALTFEQLGDRDRDLWLYDTFEGMPEPTSEDGVDPILGTDAHEEWARNQTGDVNLWCYGPLEEVERNMRGTGVVPDRLHFVKGKVEDTIPGDVPERIALLRLDTDWYESTLHELVHLYPRLVPGGVLVLDDYGHWPGARQAVDEYFAEQGIALLLNRVDNSGRIAIKPA
jgi:O-methyltransferase